MKSYSKIVFCHLVHCCRSGYSSLARLLQECHRRLNATHLEKDSLYHFLIRSSIKYSPLVRQSWDFYPLAILPYVHHCVLSPRLGRQQVEELLVVELHKRNFNYISGVDLRSHLRKYVPHSPVSTRYYLNFEYFFLWIFTLVLPPLTLVGCLSCRRCPCCGSCRCPSDRRPAQ